MVESLPSIFCLADNPRINEINQVLTLGDLKDFRQVDYAGNGWARQTFPPYLRIAQAPDLFEAFKMIAQGKADDSWATGWQPCMPSRYWGSRTVFMRGNCPLESLQPSTSACAAIIRTQRKSWTNSQVRWTKPSSKTRPGKSFSTTCKTNTATRTLYTGKTLD